APLPDGLGAAATMQAALESAGVRPEEIDYVNAHATSTPLGDINETQGIKLALRDHAKRVLVSATKSMTGHMIGASGALEALVVAKTLETGIVTPTINLDNPDPECDLDYVPHESRRADVRIAISNSFGFGGANASLVIRRWGGWAPSRPRRASLPRPLPLLFPPPLLNLIGFGIIIPLLPLYAESFGASPIVVGLLFASYSLSQLVASPALGALSDRWGRRPVLMLSLLGTVVSFVMLALARSVPWLFAARLVDGVSGGNISTARAYVADITTEDERAKPYGWIGAAFGIGFVLGPALSGAFAHVSCPAPIWLAAAITIVATALAWAWLPETVHRGAANPGPFWSGLRRAFRRPRLRRLLVVDLIYWSAFAVFQGTFALFCARRFAFDVPHTGYVLSVFGVLGVLVQVGLVPRVVGRLGERRAFVLGLLLAAIGWGGAALAHSVPLFLVSLVPA